MDEIEIEAQKQIYATLKLDSLRALAIMPDVHAGYDLPIGGVALLKGHVWPGAVGYDIGCGMCHVTTDSTVNDIPDLTDVYDRIMAAIPVGFNSHKDKRPVKPFTNASRDKALGNTVQAKAEQQIGTLGGGNHFLQVGVNSKGKIGITIHSGSRRSGWEIGDFYMKQTKGPVPVSSEIGNAYWQDMSWAVEFALDNRRRMMRFCLEALKLPMSLLNGMVNENHNHAEIYMDPQYDLCIIHRKGATPAEEGQLGIIPANIRDGVWITRGRGNKAFLCSASHGAGRTMSRQAAKRDLDFEEFQSQMEGIMAPVTEAHLDEAPNAYKPIDAVLKAQDGILVDIIDHFKPLLVVKG